MKKATFLLSLCAALWVSGCAMVAFPSAGGPASATAPEFDALPQGAARVVLLRGDKDSGGVVNVFQGGRFHVSLRAGEFTALTLCAGDASYALTSLDSPVQLSEANSARLLEKKERLAAGEQRVYQVFLQDKGAVAVRPLLATEAAWRGMTEQKRLVSRVDTDCAVPQAAPVAVAQPVQVEAVVPPVVQPAVVQPAQPATLSIPSDLVFPFASYSLNDAVGGVQIRQRLEQFIREAGITQVESVLVKGHSDPVGQPHRKELVSGERAKAVAAYVTRALNLPPNTVRAQAVSDRELLVTNCPAKPVAQRDACNAPNRRVELVITGRR